MFFTGFKVAFHRFSSSDYAELSDEKFALSAESA